MGMMIRKWERMKTSMISIRREPVMVEWRWLKSWVLRDAPIRKGINQNREGIRSKCCHRSPRWNQWRRCLQRDRLMIMHRVKERLCSDFEADLYEIAAIYRLHLSYDCSMKITTFSWDLLYPHVVCIFFDFFVKFLFF